MSTHKKIVHQDEYLIIPSLDFPVPKYPKAPEKMPKVSFCIPTLNNENTIENCLSSIIKQNYPNIEIIIVDGYSHDKTIEIAKKYTHNIYYDSGVLGSARQTGVERSTGEILAIFDSDIIIPHSEWLINAVNWFYSDEKISTVWPINIAPPWGGLVVRLYFNQWRILIEDRIRKNRGLFGGGNSLFTRKSIEEIGGINRTLHWGEDFEWAQRLKENGYKVIYHQDPLIHDTMSSLKVFIRKQFSGAKTFTKTGFQLMNLSCYDIFYEQFILGMKGMILGLIREKDISWVLYPLFFLVRTLAYGHTYLADKTL